jgi:glutathione S-transferase
MKLYYHPASITSRPVVLFLAEKGIAAELQVIDLMTGEHHQEPFVSLNPNKLVPVLDDDGFILTESGTILKYLAEKIGAPEYPTALQPRSRVNERLDWFNTQFYREYGYHLVYPQIFPHHKRPSEEGQRVTLEWGKERSALALRVLNDHIIGNYKYVCGDQLTIADYLGVSMVTAGEHIKLDFQKFPNVGRWITTMKSLPSWGDVNQVHEGLRASLAEQSFIAV